MDFSIINVLDSNLGSLQDVPVKVIYENNGSEEVVFNGFSDFIGQVFFSHQHRGKARIFLKEEFHSELKLPCFKSIVCKHCF